MATKLTGSALTVTITESLNVANSTAADSLDFAQTTTMSFADIVNVDKRIIKLANTNVTTIANFDTTESAGTYKLGDVKYIRVTNLDSAQNLQVGFEDSGSDAAYTSVAPGCSVVYTTTVVEGTVGGSTFDNVATLKVKAGHNNQNVELFVASE